MAIGKGGNVPFVGLADGIIVIVIQVPVDQSLIDSSAKEARHFQFEKLSEFIGKEGQEAINQKQNDHHKFKNRIYKEKCRSAQILFDETFEGYGLHN